ncbi:DUF881 domain-containing protein [Romboutsia lituseburensis]|uniref:DUF881 domain-containing protein n=1 Tax=Romboutsia lituseburensis TaxID=1537 RepID=UPI00215B10E2|nr:DUF881 domain-containing protein [Romboutsia lituseburensis]MCR8745350.1 DUF881 domain-containing protein [Romboutsia lituseburensis]
MRKIIKYKSIIICSIILGFLISLQLKTISLENNGLSTTKRGEQLIVELKNLKMEEKNLNIEIENIKSKINEYRKNQEDTDLKSEIKKYETLSGYTDIEGSGIEIKINENKPESSESIIYNYDLLLSMINKLNSAQANAISINGERVIFKTYFNLKGNELYINETKINEPITINAIGNPDTLASTLQIKYGIVWEIEEYYNANVEIKKKDTLKIKGYDKALNIEDY